MKYVSALLTAARGKVRGLVASHNKGGTYLRGKTIPTNPRSAGQVASRNRVSSLIARFRTTVAPSNQAGWATFAINVNVIDKLGNSILLTASNWYLKANATRMIMGLAVVDLAPTTFALSTLSPLTGSVIASGGTIQIGWAASDDWQSNSNTGGVAIYASRPQNSTVNYFTGPYRFAGTVRSAATSGTLSVPLPFPAGPTGSKIFIRAVASAPDGRPSAVFRLPVVVP
jgi:hypothetical protein